jgi:LCP family protein required for cell wall assembly
MPLQPAWRWRVFASRFVTALVIVSMFSAGGLAYAFWFANDQITHHTIVAPIPHGVLDEGKATEPANYLIVGSDSRGFVKDPVAEAHFGDPKYNTGQRSDTIMIAHVDPNSPGKGFLVSIPRDTWVKIPGHGTQKINAAYNYGPPALIETIQQDFGVKINHYLEVGFDTFADIVNAIGNVDIFFPAQARDVETGLDITTPGCVPLNGLQALEYVRSREYEYRSSSTQDWQPDNKNDFGRIDRQQYFIRSLAQEAINKGARNPLTARALLTKTVSHLTRDPDMGLSDFLSLVRAFRSVDPGAVQMVTIPTTSAVIYPNGHQTDVQYVDQQKAAPYFARLGTFTAKPSKPTPVPKIPRGEIRVQVLNGSGVRGIASTASSGLTAAGFASGGAATDADRHDYTTTEIRYAPGAVDKARVAATYLGGVGQLVALKSSPAGADVVIVLGRDFVAVTAPGTRPVATSTSPSSTALPNSGSTPGVTVPLAEPGQQLVGCG